MAEPLSAKGLYFFVNTCPCCGRRIRASALLRHWKDKPVPTFDDAEFMTTSSEGRGKLKNTRSPFWSGLAALTAQNFSKTYPLRQQTADFFQALASRLRAAEHAAIGAAGRARSGSR